MMLMLLDTGIDKASAANAISAFALGSLIGRGACGLALDRFPAPIVAALSMVLPALGYVLIAGSHGALPVVMGAMLLIGISFGADADLPLVPRLALFPPRSVQLGRQPDLLRHAVRRGERRAAAQRIAGALPKLRAVPVYDGGRGAGGQPAVPVPATTPGTRRAPPPNNSREMAQP